MPGFITVIEATMLPKRTASSGEPVILRTAAAPAVKLSPAPQMSIGCAIFAPGIRRSPAAVINRGSPPAASHHQQRTFEVPAEWLEIHPSQRAY